MTVKITGGTVVDPYDGSYPAELLVDGDRITAIGTNLPAADQTIEAAGRMIMPGAIDAHSHADARVFDDDVQLGLLRSGVTSVIAGQDGISFAPGDGRYATDYFGALNGRHPSYRGGGVGALLEAWDGRTRLNVGYLVPAGTVRYEVLGRKAGRPTASELAAMVGMVGDGMAAGALGLSTGLDYVPGVFADAAELAALCEPVADASGIYVSHIRGYEENAGVGIDELIEICRRSGVRGHASHFHARPELIAELIERTRQAGVRFSWDAYPYFRGFTLLSMVLLPSELIMLGNAEAAHRLQDETVRSELAAGFAARVEEHENLGIGWEHRIRIASAGIEGDQDLEGLTLAEAGARRGLDPLQVGFRLLAGSGLTTTTVMEIPQPRTDDHLARQFALAGACSGSDGIFFGGAPHPRGFGCVARMYGRFGRERGDFDWPQLARITSGTAAEAFGLSGRGRVAAGAVADLVLLDPTTVADRADYANPRELSVGIDQVLVRGRLVLDGGELTADLAGGSVRRG